MNSQERQFLAREQIFVGRVSEKLGRDPYLFSAMKSWPVLSLTERQDFLDHFARAFANELDVIDPMVQWFSQPQNADGTILRGVFNEQGQYGPTVFLNEHKDALSGGLLEILNVVCHEVAHYRQACAPDARGTIPKEIRARMRQEKATYKDAKKYGYEAYQNQLIEVHARAVALAAEKGFAHALETTSKIHLDDKSFFEIQEEYEKTGRIAFPFHNGVFCSDPRRYYFDADALEEKMRGPRGSPAIVHDYLKAISKAILYGEHVSGLYSPRQALQSLVKVMKFPPRYFQPHHMKQAQNVLVRCTKSPNVSLSAHAKKAAEDMEAVVQQRRVKNPARVGSFSR